MDGEDKATIRVEKNDEDEGEGEEEGGGNKSKGKKVMYVTVPSAPLCLPLAYLSITFMSTSALPTSSSVALVRYRVIRIGL